MRNEIGNTVGHEVGHIAEEAEDAVFLRRFGFLFRRSARGDPQCVDAEDGESEILHRGYGGD